MASSTRPFSRQPSHLRLDPADANATSTEQQVEGRCDASFFQDALSVVDDLQQCVMSTEESGRDIFPVADKVDAMLLEHLESMEQEDADDDDIRSRESVFSDSSQSLPSMPPPEADAMAVDGHGATPPSQTATRVVETVQPTRRRIMTAGFIKATVSQAAINLLTEAWSTLILLGPYAVLLWVNSNDRDDEFEWYELLLRLLYSLVAARTVTLVLEHAIIRPIRHHLPGLVLLVLQAVIGWPLTTTLWLLMTQLFKWTDTDSSAWASLFAIRNFASVSIWLVGTAVSRCALEVATQLWLNRLTLRHFERRTKDAYLAHRALRRVVGAARIAEKAEAREAKARHAKSKSGQIGRPARHSSSTVTKAVKDSASPVKVVEVGEVASDAAGSAPAPEPADACVPTPSAASVLTAHDHGHSEQPKIDKLSRQLQRLSGPFEFGSGFADAPTLDQARKRAQRVFPIIARQRALAPSESQADAAQALVDREAMLRWAFQHRGLSHAEIETAVSESTRALPTLNQQVGIDNFVTAVERCYKEQKLLTASVDAFSKTHVLLNRVWLSLWWVIIITVGLFAWGIDVATWVIPFTSFLLSFSFIVGRVPADFISGATYALVVRPYDIGDRITLSQPGSKASLYSLVVKDIDLMRTTLITSNGETLLLENHMLRNLCITNLTRSGEVTLFFQIQVPVSTSTSKITELVDSIRQYVAEKDTEWESVHLMFSATDFEAGHIVLDVWPCTRFPAQVRGL